MNRSRIEWCDHTLNIITGCRHECPYCYARTMARRFSGDVRRNLQAVKHVTLENGCYELNEPFLDENGKQIIYPFAFEPTFHKYRLDILDNYKGGQNIFVGAMADIFGDWVPDEWLHEVFSACAAHEKNNYLFLTKNPARYGDLDLPGGERYWYGTTVTNDHDLTRISALPKDRHVFLSIEPMLGPVMLPENAGCDIGWIILGAETGRRKGKVIPKFEWVVEVAVLWADKRGIPVFMKESMVPVVQEKNMRREFPEALKHKPMGDGKKRRLYSECIECGAVFRQDTMVTLSARVGRYDKNRRLPSKTAGSMCRPCFECWCDAHGISIDSGELYGDKEDRGDEEETP